MIKLINIELYKIFKKWRSYIGFIAIAVLVPVIEFALQIEGHKSIDFITRDLQQSFLFVGNLLNTYFVSYLILNSLTVHIPFLITLVAGDLLAGESTAGTYRLLLTRPVSRMQIVSSKFIAGLIYSFLLILLLAVFSLGLGYLLLGTGELIVFRNGIITVFAKNDILWRFLLAYCSAVLSMSVVASLAFLFSALVENAIGPIISTMAIIIIFLIVSAINVDIFQSIRPYLFTSYMGTWSMFFDKPLDRFEIVKSTLILLGHIAGLFGLASYIFYKKDILT
ncbi:MAG: ABC transporter permease subunit [Ignavibacteriaceae bacterium]|jgi:ABC-2 type transport system permease protein